MYHVPSVAIMGGTFAITTSSPLNAPAAMPTNRDNSAASGMLMPETQSFAKTTEVRAITPAGERSMPPDIISIVAAQAIIIRVLSWRTMLIRLLTVRYLLLIHERITIISTRISIVTRRCFVCVFVLSFFIGVNSHSI